MKVSLLKIGASVAGIAALAGVALYHWIEETPIGFADVSRDHAQTSAAMASASFARKELPSPPAGPISPHRQLPTDSARSNSQPAVATFAQARHGAGYAATVAADERVTSASGAHPGQARSVAAPPIADPNGAAAFHSQSGRSASLSVPITPSAVAFAPGSVRPAAPPNSARDTAERSASNGKESPGMPDASVASRSERDSKEAEAPENQTNAEAAVAQNRARVNAPAQSRWRNVPRGPFTPEEELERAQYGWQAFNARVFEEATAPAQEAR